MSQSVAPSVVHRETVHRYLTVRQTRQSHDLEIVLPIGEIDLCTAPVLARAFEDTDRREVPNVLVDLSKVGFLALVGVQVLLAAANRAADAGRRVVLMAPTAKVQRVLSLTGAVGELEVHTSAASALTALSLTASH
jgi:anti-sigma B factor antagonist